MNNAKSASHSGPGFVSKPEHHKPRTRRSLILLAIGLVLVAVGYFLISNDLPKTSIRRAQVTGQWLPTGGGLICLAFGVFGLATALIGIRRSGKQAIDLLVDRAGIVIRGDQTIPWECIKSVVSIEYRNNSKIKLLWNEAELHRAFLVTVDDGINLPGRGSGQGSSEVKISLLRYPTKQYLRHYENAVSQFARHGINVERQKKWMQT